MKWLKIIYSYILLAIIILTNLCNTLPCSKKIRKESLEENEGCTTDVQQCIKEKVSFTHNLIKAVSKLCDKIVHKNIYFHRVVTEEKTKTKWSDYSLVDFFFIITENRPFYNYSNLIAKNGVHCRLQNVLTEIITESIIVQTLSRTL